MMYNFICSFQKKVNVAGILLSLIISPLAFAEATSFTTILPNDGTSPTDIAKPAGADFDKDTAMIKSNTDNYLNGLTNAQTAYTDIFQQLALPTNLKPGLGSVTNNNTGNANFQTSTNSNTTQVNTVPSGSSTDAVAQQNSTVISGSISSTTGSGSNQTSAGTVSGIQY